MDIIPISSRQTIRDNKVISNGSQKPVAAALYLLYQTARHKSWT